MTHGMLTWKTQDSQLEITNHIQRAVETTGQTDGKKSRCDLCACNINKIGSANEILESVSFMRCINLT